MDELKYNSEGYYDPTTYEALMKIEQEERAVRKAANYRPLVYICSPYAGDVEKNTCRARSYRKPGSPIGRWYISAPHFPAMWNAMQRTPADTAVLLLTADTFPLRRTCCFRSLCPRTRNAILLYLWAACFLANATRYGCSATG